MTRSQNGWPVLRWEETRQWRINERAPRLRLEDGPGGFVLAHWALWFADNVERLQQPTLDDWGWADRLVRGSLTAVSNHASGTALDLNAQQHPLGSRETFTDDQEWRLVRRLRCRYGGVIRWGGAYEGRVDEMHFELVAGRPEVRALARRLRDTDRGQRILSRNPGVSL